MDWKSASEVVAGKILEKKYDPHTVNPSTLCSPYDQMVVMLQAGKSQSDVIVEGIPYSAVEAAINAAAATQEADEKTNWLQILEQSASRAVGGRKLRKQADLLEKGNEADIGAILQVVSQLDKGYRELTPLSQVDATPESWISTGYAPLDEHIGGLPDSGLTVLAASPGVGKTSLALLIASKFVKHHKDKRVAIFTLEMTMGQIARRFLDITKMTKEERERIILCEDVIGPSELYALATRAASQDPLGLIIIDFADHMVEGEQSESIMGVIYRTMANLAKRTHTPVLLLAQLNRDTYSGGIPRINHIRYSGLAEAMSALILLIYNPHNIFVDFKDQQLLPSQGGIGYIIEGKSRFGYKHDGPGAVQVDWDGEAGWGDKSRGWFVLAGG